MKLTRPNKLDNFLDHLAMHSDDSTASVHKILIGVAKEDIFTSCPDDYELPSTSLQSQLIADVAERYLIIRDILPQQNYLTHWLALFIATKLLTPNLLIFQELDALCTQ